MTDKEFLNDLLDLNPNDLSVFQEESNNQKFVDPNLYKTNPINVDEKVSPDGHYHSKVRIIYNPFNRAKSIVNKERYSFRDNKGFFMMDSVLTNGDKNCPVFKAWKALHYSTDTNIVINYNGEDLTRKEWGDKIFDKTNERFCLVQIIEDVNQPEKVGKFMGWKLPRAIFDMINAKMNPTDKTKTPQDVMNYVFGPILNIDVTPGPDDPKNPERRQREIKYNLCEFESDPSPIIKKDGTNLFDEDEMDKIQDYWDNKKILSNAKSTAKKKEDAKKKCEGLVEDLKKIIEKAVTYITENSIDIDKEFGYHAPSEETIARVNRWLETVNNFHDPLTYSGEATVQTAQETPNPEPTQSTPEPTDDLPF